MVPQRSREHKLLRKHNRRGNCKPLQMGGIVRSDMIALGMGEIVVRTVRHFAEPSPNHHGRNARRVRNDC